MYVHRCVALMGRLCLNSVAAESDKWYLMIAYINQTEEYVQSTSKKFLLFTSFKNDLLKCPAMQLNTPNVEVHLS